MLSDELRNVHFIDKQRTKLINKMVGEFKDKIRAEALKTVKDNPAADTDWVLGQVWALRDLYVGVDALDEKGSDSL